MGNNREFICLSYDLIGNGYFQKLIFVVLIYFSCFAINQVGASIHEYQNQSFFRRSNSFFFHGGSEGLYASKLHVDPDKKPSTEENHLYGKSFIRSTLCFFSPFLDLFLFSQFQLFLLMLHYRIIFGFNDHYQLNALFNLI